MTDLPDSTPKQATPPPPPPDGAPTTQSPNRINIRSITPAWIQELPYFLGFPKPKPNYRFIDEQVLNQLLTDCDPQVVQEIRQDIAFMDRELMRLFRERDYDAAYSQNRYRVFQILYIMLATLAGMVGGLQALYVQTNANATSLLALVETVIALIATFVATISAREPPLPEWLNNRRRAEHMRREFFRYLLHIAPYDRLDAIDRKLALSRRAADINRGVYPDEPVQP